MHVRRAMKRVFKMTIACKRDRVIKLCAASVVNGLRFSLLSGYREGRVPLTLYVAMVDLCNFLKALLTYGLLGMLKVWVYKGVFYLTR